MRINAELHPFDTITMIKCPRNPEIEGRTDIFVDHKYTNNGYLSTYNCYYNNSAYVDHEIGPDDIYDLTATREEKDQERKEKNKQKNADQRKRFFNLINTEDDGRYELWMTKDEFNEFKKNKEIKEAKYNENELRGAKQILVYFYQNSYTDDIYVYVEATDTIYVSRYSIGD